MYDAAMRLKLVQAGEPILRAVAQPLAVKELASRGIQRLIEDMRETLEDAPGVGLAAPQVGVSVQLAIIQDLPEYTRDLPAEQLTERERQAVPFHVIVNPVLKPIGKPTVEFFEGCLSVNGFTAVVPRYRNVQVTCLDEKGTKRVIQASGWYARILQHEIDHLNGTLYIDRMRSRTFCSLENYGRYWKSQSVSDVLKQLRRK
jgi:peptide deformylase